MSCGYQLSQQFVRDLRAFFFVNVQRERESSHQLLTRDLDLDAIHHPGRIGYGDPYCSPRLLARGRYIAKGTASSSPTNPATVVSSARATAESVE